MPHHQSAHARTVDLTTRSTLSDYAEIAAAAGVRRILTQFDELPVPGRATILHATATAVISNPWVGTSTDTDLIPESQRIAPILAKLLVDRLLAALGGAEQVEAFGKASIVGLAGEIEHAGAFIHTPYFGNLMRDALGGTAVIASVDGRAEPGELLRVPLVHKTAAATRSHYQTVEVSLTDAPHAAEVAVVAAASTGPRPFARLGDRTTDQPVHPDILKEIAL